MSLDEIIKIHSEKEAALEKELEAAKKDIAEILFKSGECQYCAHSKEKKLEAITLWMCALDKEQECNPVWRGIKNENH